MSAVLHVTNVILLVFWFGQHGLEVLNVAAIGPNEAHGLQMVHVGRGWCRAFLLPLIDDPFDSNTR
jgi:hypothetical protein